MASQVPEYGWAAHTSDPPSVARLWPALKRILDQRGHIGRVMDLGCGNGALGQRLIDAGAEVVGIDASEQGIERAQQRCPDAEWKCAYIEDALVEHYGENSFDHIVSTEVIEHIYAPREWASVAYRLLKPGGLLLCTTPFHGYVKNLALAVSGKWQHHANPLWDGGHIKLWSRDSLMKLLAEQGFTDLTFEGVGRMPHLWMSMIVTGQKPKAPNASSNGQRHP